MGTEGGPAAQLDEHRERPARRITGRRAEQEPSLTVRPADGSVAIQQKHRNGKLLKDTAEQAPFSVRRRRATGALSEYSLRCGEGLLGEFEFSESRLEQGWVLDAGNR
jgi:hypothetical protein